METAKARWVVEWAQVAHGLQVVDDRDLSAAQKSFQALLSEAYPQTWSTLGVGLAPPFLSCYAFPESCRSSGQAGVHGGWVLWHLRGNHPRPCWHVVTWSYPRRHGSHARPWHSVRVHGGLGIVSAGGQGAGQVRPQMGVHGAGHACWDQDNICSQTKTHLLQLL